MCRVMYSIETGSSTVNRWDWHSILALSIRTLASAVNPAAAKQTWESKTAIFRTVRGSWSFKVDFFSTPRTTTSWPRTPTWWQIQSFRILAVSQCTNSQSKKKSSRHRFPCAQLRGPVLQEMSPGAWSNKSFKQDTYIFHLEEMAIRREDCQCSVVSRHVSFLKLLLLCFVARQLWTRWTKMRNICNAFDYFTTSKSSMWFYNLKLIGLQDLRSSS